MAIEGIGAALALAAQATAQTAQTASGSTAPGDFGSWLQRQMTESNRQISESDAKLRELAAGGDVYLHDVMLSLEEAKLSFELILAVRNKALEAYQELMRMQI